MPEPKSNSIFKPSSMPIISAPLGDITSAYGALPVEIFIGSESLHSLLKLHDLTIIE